MVGNIFGGHWIDTYGRKKMLLTGMLAVTIILLFYPLAHTGGQLFVIRFIHGLAGGVLIPAAFAYVGDQSSDKSRVRVMAYTGASIGTAAIVGPALGGAIAANSKIEHVFLLVSILFVISSFLIMKYVKESYVGTDRGKFSISEFIPLIKNPHILKASLAAFALMINMGTLSFALPIKVGEAGATNPVAITGMLLSIYGLVTLIVFLTPMNRIYDRLNPSYLVIIGISIIGSVHVMLNIVSIIPVLFLLMIVYGFGFSFVFPSMNRIVSDATSKLERGKAYGVFYAFFSLGAVLGSFVSGLASEYLGMPFFSSAFTTLSIAIILFLIERQIFKRSKA